MDWNYYLGIAIKMVTVIVLLIVYTRMSGSRRLAPVTVFDNISNLVVGAIAGTTLLNNTVRPIDLGMFMTIWLLLLVIIRFFRKEFRIVKIILDGSPIELIKKGKMDPKAFKRAGLSPTIVQTMLRTQGIVGPHAVYSAIFERSGKLSISESKDDQFSIIMIDNGEIKLEALERAGYDEAWLQGQLEEVGSPDPATIFCAEWDREHLWLTFYEED